MKNNSEQVILSMERYKQLLDREGRFLKDIKVFKFSSYHKNDWEVNVIEYPKEEFDEKIRNLISELSEEVDRVSKENSSLKEKLTQVEYDLINSEKCLLKLVDKWYNRVLKIFKNG